MKSIAFYNNKGGVGKTTSVINIAYELSGENSVLVIDVDGQANCSRFFTEELKEGLDKALVNTEVSPETALCHTRYDNIDIITATPKLNGITSEFDSFTDEEQAANNLDVVGTAGSQKQIILLVDKGREGWNCRSLFSVAMFRSPKSKVFVLQATMRCLRQITDEQQSAMVFLSKDNLDILNDELRENFDMTVEELSTKSDSKRKPYEVRVLPPPRYITIKTVRHKYNLTEKEYSAPVDFGLVGFDYSKYEATIYEKRGLAADTTLKERNADNLRDNLKFSLFMLVGEIAKYLNIKCSAVAKILNECVDGVDLVLEKVNLYNDVLYDIIIPKIFNTLWEEKVEKITEERKLLLLRQPDDKEYYTFSALPELVVRRDDVEMERYKERSFHADTYCFDSKPEKECFYQYITNTDLVKSV